MYDDDGADQHRRSPRAVSARIEQRRANGLDRYDEWWEGVYRIVTGPSPEHGEFIVVLGCAPASQGAGARSWPVAPGQHRRRQVRRQGPGPRVFRRDTSRTSPAFLETAELVVEVLSPGERAGEKLPFYASRNVKEYLEVDLRLRTVRLLANVEGQWRDVRASSVIDLSVDEVSRCCPTRDFRRRPGRRLVIYTQPMQSRYSGANEAMRNALARLSPGTPLRDGIDRIVRAKAGALLVLNDEPDVLAICSGGFLVDAPFSPQRLSELAKMDGAIIISTDGGRIARANVHLVPDPTVPTSETGTRHRTAERVARSLDVPVISASEEMGVINVYAGGTKRQLQEVGRLLDRANQALQTLERYKIRLDDALNNLTALEIEDVVTVRNVVTVIQRGEMVHRIADEIETMIIELGLDARLLRLQLDETYSEVDDELDDVIADYLPAAATQTTRSPSSAASATTTCSTPAPRSPRCTSATSISTTRSHRRACACCTACTSSHPSWRRRSPTSSAGSRACSG